MPEFQSAGRKLRIFWGIVALVCCLGAWFCFQLFGPNLSIHVARDTTFVTEPLGLDGLPDYHAYLLRQASDGVTPENNAAVLIWQAMWPGEMGQEYWLPLCNALGMDAIPSPQESLVAPYDETVRRRIAQEWAQRLPEPTGSAEDVDQDTDDSDPFGNPDNDRHARLADERAEALIDEAMGHPWTSEQIPALAEWVESNETPLDLLVEAAARPRYFSPSPNMLDDSDSLLIAMLHPDMQMMRTAVRALQVRSMWQMGEGRTADAWQDLLACHRLARLTAENDTVVGQLVAIAIDGVACNGTHLFLHHGYLSGKESQQILADLNKLGQASSCLRSIDQGERLLFIDTALAVASGRAELADLVGTDGTSAALGLIARTRIDWNQILQNGNAWYDELVLAARLPTRDQRKAEFNRIDRNLGQVSALNNSPAAWIGSTLSSKRRHEMVSILMMGLLLPATSAVFNAEDRSNCQLELTRLAAALAVYRAQQGEYPEQLGDLVPAVLKQLPIDLYSGKSFIYRRMDDAGYLLYSVFENETDDGGTSLSGDIVAGEWPPPDSAIQPEDFSSDGSDLVIRVPVPKFKIH